MTNIENVFDAVLRYFGTVGWLVVFLAAGLYTIITSRKGNRLKCVVCAVLYAALILNPWTLRLSEQFFSGTYYRFFWILPVTIIIAFAMTHLLADQKRLVNRLFVGAVFGVLFVMVGSSSEVFSEMTFPENGYLISDEAITMSEALRDASGHNKGIAAAMPELLLCQVREYDASIRSPIRRVGYQSTVKTNKAEGRLRYEKILIDTCMTYAVHTRDEIRGALDKTATRFIVVKKNEVNGEAFAYVLAYSGCEYKFSTANYDVYKVVNAKTDPSTLLGHYEALKSAREVRELEEDTSASELTVDEAILMS